MSRGYFITGTDTEIGKTFAVCAMMVAWRARGYAVAPMKPIAAGVVECGGIMRNEDVHKLLQAYGEPLDDELVNPYCFHQPIAPHIAAARAGTDIDVERIRRAYSLLAEGHDIVLVEGAGGFLVPMDHERSLALLPAVLDIPVLLVVGMRLGCLNHALLTAEAVRARGLRLAGWIANTSSETMSAYEENIDTLQRLMAAPCLGAIPRIDVSGELAAIEASVHLDPDVLLD